MSEGHLIVTATEGEALRRRMPDVRLIAEVDGSRARQTGRFIVSCDSPGLARQVLRSIRERRP